MLKSILPKSRLGKALSMPTVLAIAILLPLVLISQAYAQEPVSTPTSTTRPSIIEDIRRAAERHVNSDSEMQTEQVVDRFRINAASIKEGEIADIYEQEFVGLILAKEAAKKDEGVVERWIEPNVGTVGSVAGGVSAVTLAAIFAYRRLERQLKINTHISFLQTLLSSDDYRSQLDSILESIWQADFGGLSTGVNQSHVMYYLFLLNPELREEINNAIEGNDMNQVENLFKKLLLLPLAGN